MEHHESGVSFCLSVDGRPDQRPGDEAQDDEADPLGAFPRRGEAVSAGRTPVGGTGNLTPAGGTLPLAELRDVVDELDVHHGKLGNGVVFCQKR